MHGSSPALFLGGDLKISDKNNLGGGGPEQIIKFGEGAKFKGASGAMNPNDTMVVVLKDILCLLGFRFIYIVYISWYYM